MSSRLLLILLSSLATLVIVLGVNSGLSATNSVEFCISCHEMEQTVYQEYKKSTHFSNASGVRASCTDCHLPPDIFPKIERKLLSVNELYHWVLGTIDTVEKFEARREILAKRVWQHFEKNDSAECRSCHSYEAMDFKEQSRRAKDKMHDAAEKGKTCIECHKGIAHKLPEGYEDDD